jgi:hypothetical protein
MSAEIIERFSGFQWVAGMTGTDGPSRHILDDNRTRTYDSAGSNAYTGMNEGLCSDPCIITNRDRERAQGISWVLIVVRTRAKMGTLGNNHPFTYDNAVL